MNIQKFYILRKLSHFIDDLTMSNQPMRNILYNGFIKSMNEYCTCNVPRVGYTYLNNFENVRSPPPEFDRWLVEFIRVATGIHDEYTLEMLNVVLKEE